MQLSFLDEMPKDCQLHIRQVVDKELFYNAKLPVEQLTRDNMVQQLAKNIILAKHKKDISRYSVTLSIDLLVFSPDEFAGIVRKAAEALEAARRFGQPHYGHAGN